MGRKNDDNSATQRSIGHDIREFPRGREEKGKSGFSKANTDVPGTNLEERKGAGGDGDGVRERANERADEREEEGKVRLQQGQHRRPGDERTNERTSLSTAVLLTELWQRNPRVHPVPLRRRPALQTACWGRTNERTEEPATRPRGGRRRRGRRRGRPRWN